MAYRLILLLLVEVCFSCLVEQSLRADEPAPRPLMRDFLGVNGHTVQFKPDLYSKVCRKVRDYHSLEWDVGKETDYVPRFPEARNRVNWDNVYGSWQKAGFETDVCLMFNNTPPDSWKEMAVDARNYGRAFAAAFGPSSPKKLVASFEIGNEPGHYSDEQYRLLFASMAQGLREGDPKLKIATCNLTTGKSGKYEKSVECIAGQEQLCDVLTIHSYAMLAGWPTWKRSYPEDPSIEFLKSIESLIAWRDKNAKGKEIWVTEFGWDATTKPNHKEGTFAKWEGNVSDEKQAQYLVRAFLVFSAMDVNRAYLYFFNDSDEPSFHASSGITRNFVPKPSFHAIAHLYKTLGDYRFHRILKKDNTCYAFEFIHGAEPGKRLIAVWSPTGSGQSAEVEIPVGKARFVAAEKMPLDDKPAGRFEPTVEGGALRLSVTESPAYLWLEEN